MVKAVLCGSSLFGTICGRENLSTRVGERGATIRPLGKFLDWWKSYKRGWVGVYLVQRTIKAIFSTVTSSAAMMRSPSFSRSVESRTTMNSPFPVTPGLFVSKNSFECSLSSTSFCYSFTKTIRPIQIEPLSLPLSPTNSMAMKITYGRPQPPPGSNGKWDLSLQMKPFRFLIAYCSRLVVVAAVVVVDMGEYRI